ncbi:MAG: type IX secretion system outer membrane channel protein PorV [Flavobacteriaceae bacterium]
MRTLTFLIIYFTLGTLLSFAQKSNRVITTGVPFLLITSDARAAGMGDQGVATSADNFSQYWNPAKFVFSSNKKGFGLSYTPYLSKLVDDIFLGNVSYYSKMDERSSWATSLRYFSLGDIQFNDFIGGSIIDQGTERPSELTLDLSYALKLSQEFSMAIAGRFIYSDLKVARDSDTSSASSFGVDIAAFYQSKIFNLKSNKAIFRSGLNISNIGPKLNYDSGEQRSFIPTNLRTGLGLDLLVDENNSLGFYIEFSKLLVPTPVAVYDESQNLIGYSQPDIDFINGIFTSFSDSPDGLSEELSEITVALGLEYNFEDAFSIRTGYFSESKEKGSRRYLTMGAGFNLNFIDIDISYLFSTSGIRNPLENTIRFSLSLNIDQSSSEPISSSDSENSL